jgi:hypothetical protein
MGLNGIDNSFSLCFFSAYALNSVKSVRGAPEYVLKLQNVEIAAAEFCSGLTGTLALIAASKCSRSGAYAILVNVTRITVFTMGAILMLMLYLRAIITFHPTYPVEFGRQIDN